MMRRFVPAIAAAIIVLSCAVASATPTQDEVFRSIHDNVGPTFDARKALPYLVAAVAAVILIVVVNQRLQRPAVRRNLNHPGKLLRQVRRSLHLQTAELKQLKLLAQEQEISSPLTLLLCPSVLAKALRSGNPRIDRQVVQQVVQRLRDGLSAIDAGPTRKQ
jgi:hypothetical protein